MSDRQEEAVSAPEGDPQPPSHAPPHPPAPSTEALLEEGALLRELLDASPTLVFVKDRHGRFVLANAAFARLHDSTPEQIVLRSEREVHGHAGEADGFLEMDRRVISTRETVRLEEQVTRPDGDVWWLETTKKPLVRRSGEVQVIGFCVDITERKRAQLELERTARELEAMAVAAQWDAAEKAALAEELDRKLAIIEAQHREIAALSVPILEMGDGVIGVPIIGVMDEPRAAALTERLLAAIAERQVQRVVLDLSTQGRP